VQGCMCQGVAYSRACNEGREGEEAVLAESEQVGSMDECEKDFDGVAALYSDNKTRNDEE